jgi:hypothetical protein
MISFVFTYDELKLARTIPFTKKRFLSNHGLENNCVVNHWRRVKWLSQLLMRNWNSKALYENKGNSLLRVYNSSKSDSKPSVVHSSTSTVNSKYESGKNRSSVGFFFFLHSNILLKSLFLVCYRRYLGRCCRCSIQLQTGVQATHLLRTGLQTSLLCPILLCPGLPRTCLLCPSIQG